MTDPRATLQRKFEQRDRFANFGDVLMKITVSGFRGHANTLIDIRSPITAFCGLNGCGKSTIVELAAAAYRPPAGTAFQISTFFAVGPLDSRALHSAGVSAVRVLAEQPDGAFDCPLKDGTFELEWVSPSTPTPCHVRLGGHPHPSCGAP